MVYLSTQLVEGTQIIQSKNGSSPSKQIRPVAFANTGDLGVQTLCPDSGHHLQRIPQSQLSPPRTERLLRRTILLADDDRHFRLALRKRLEGQGFHVMESADGFRALIKAQMDSIDVFILDHEMPGGEGREVAEVIRKQSSAPIIFLSGYSKETFRDTVFRLADTYYLPKPLNFDHLTQLLTDCLGSTSE